MQNQLLNIHVSCLIDVVFLYFVHFQLLKVCVVPIATSPCFVVWTCSHVGPAKILTPRTGESALQPKNLHPPSHINSRNPPKLMVLSWFLMFYHGKSTTTTTTTTKPICTKAG